MKPSKFLSATLAALLLAAPVMAAEKPLAPGKPAGTRQAVLEGGNALLYIAGFAAVAAIIAVTAGQGGTDGITTPTTTGTAP